MPMGREPEDQNVITLLRVTEGLSADEDGRRLKLGGAVESGVTQQQQNITVLFL